MNEKEIFIILQKYMKHVLSCEGVTFVSEINRYPKDVEFTDYEKQFLETVEQQIED